MTDKRLCCDMMLAMAGEKRFPQPPAPFSSLSIIQHILCTTPVHTAGAMKCTQGALSFKTHRLRKPTM